jgi:hypothetical protein
MARNCRRRSENLESPLNGGAGLIAIIFGLPALLVVGATTGSMLGTDRRRLAEKYVLMPLLVLLGVAGLVLMFVQRNWLGLAGVLVSFAVTMERFMRHIWGIRSERS